MFKKFLIASALSLTLGVTHAAGEINICYVKSPFNLQNIVMKEKGLLEKEFAKDNVKIVWHEINSGAQQNLAIASGALDVSAVMNTTSLLLGVSNGTPMKAVTGVAHPGNVFALVAKKDGPANVKQLKGKTIAGPKGTVLHQMLVSALKSEGLTIKDVNFISMDPPKAYAAVSSGSVDAGLLAAGLILKANANGLKTITTAKGHIKPNLVMVASNNFIDKRPKDLARVIKVHRETLAWIRSNFDEALAMGAKAQGVDMDSARKLYSWSSFYDVMTKDDIEGLKADQEFLIANKMMTKRIDVNTLVTKSAFK